MKYPFYIRMTILLCIGGFAPILIHHIIMKLWDKYTEYTFIVCIDGRKKLTIVGTTLKLLLFTYCIPVAFWMAEKIQRSVGTTMKQENGR